MRNKWNTSVGQRKQSESPIEFEPMNFRTPGGHSIQLTWLSTSSRGSVDRAPARCSGGHGFKPTLVLHLFHPHKTFMYKYGIVINIELYSDCLFLRLKRWWLNEKGKMCTLLQVSGRVFLRYEGCSVKRKFFNSSLKTQFSYFSKKTTIVFFKRKLCLEQAFSACHNIFSFIACIFLGSGDCPLPQQLRGLRRRKQNRI